MITKTPECEIQSEISMQDLSVVSMEVPIQKMFDEFMVFISKTDFEQRVLKFFQYEKELTQEVDSFLLAKRLEF